MARPDDSTPPRVFVSYTLDPQSDALRERLVRALGSAGFEAWMGVPSGDQPGPARDRYPDESRAAVAIVSPLARESEWMRTELELLRERAQRDPAFVLAVLATADTDAEALAGWASYAVARDADPEVQIEQVLQRLAPLREHLAAGAPGENGRGGFTVLRAGQHAGGVGAVALVSLAGRACVVTGDGVGTLRVLDIGRDELHFELPALHAGFISAIAIGMLGGIPVAVSAGYDGILHVVDLIDARPVAGQAVHQGPIGALALLDVSPGPLAVAGGHDGTVQAWDLTSGEIGERASKPDTRGSCGRSRQRRSPGGRSRSPAARTAASGSGTSRHARHRAPPGAGTAAR